MVATICKLKFAIIRNSWRRSTATLVFTLLAVIAMVPMIPLIAIGAGAVGLRLDDHQSQIGAVVTLIGALVLVMWMLLPLLFFGADETLDPRRFALFPIPRGQLTAGLTVSSFIGLPGIFTLLGMVMVSFVWLRHPLAMALGAFGIAVGVVLCVVASRLVTTLASQGLSSRRGRDLTAGISVFVILGVSLGFQVASQLAARAAEADASVPLQALQSMGRIASFTPLGAPWAVGWDAATGQWSLAGIHLAIACASLALVFWAWSAGLARAMVTPLSTAGGGKARSDNAMIRSVSRPWWPVRLRPAIAVMTRCLRYWRADPRYLSSALVLPVIPAMFVVLALIVPDYPQQVAVLGVPFSAMMIGFATSNDVASDSTAFWMHVSTGVRGWADRLGRALAVLVWAVPVIVILCVAVLAIVGDLSRWPAGIGLSLGVLLVGIGVGSISSAMVIYPVALPGESPFATRSGRGSMRSIASMGVLGITVAVSLPIIVLGAIGTFGDPLFGWITLTIGPVAGGLCAALGVHLGGRVYERRSVSVLTQLVSYDS